MRRFLFLVFVLAGCSQTQSEYKGTLLVIDGGYASLDGNMFSVDAGGLTDAAIRIDDLGPRTDSGEADSGVQCQTAMGALPDLYETLAHHDDDPISHVQAQDWAIGDTLVAEARLNESVVFELDRPARILGYAVQFGRLPDDASASLKVSLHRDFGYNGFDFWPDPVASGSQCRADVQPGEWVDYILETPVSVGHPGLVHIVHQRSGDGAALLFDGSPPTPDCVDDCCNAFGACHSAWNFPELNNFRIGEQLNYAYNGLSLTFRYDYLVRLYVEYTDDIDLDQQYFRRIDDVDTSNRMAWGDYDNDGDDDLLVNGPRLLQNNSGDFVDVTESAGLAGDTFFGSGIFGDYDNDGCLDIFLFDENYQRSDHLLRSDCNGGFVDVTEAAGFNDIVAADMSCDGGDRAPTPAATWIDFDGDGFLDLYLANFICWSSGHTYLDQVWRSRGDGTFEEWTGQFGFPTVDDRREALASRGALGADFDGDGDVDLLANTYRLHRNLYYRNDGSTFTEVGEENGLSGQPTRWQGWIYYGHSIGTAVGDLDGDADLDLVIANLAHPRFYDFSDKTQVLLNDGDGTFRDIQGDWSTPDGQAGIRFQETHSIPTLGDFDNDGVLDLVISAIYDGRPTDFYWGQGDGTFELDAWRSGVNVRNGWGQAASDIDGDGRLDLATSGGIYQNQKATQGHWLQVRVVGNQGANRAGIGSTVRVDAGDETYLRVISGGNGQGCQDSLSPHIGLGSKDMIERISVRFPGSDAAVVYEGPFAVDQRVWLYQDGRTQFGWQADW